MNEFWHEVLSITSLSRSKQVFKRFIWFFFPVECPDVYIVERLFSSSLVVVVSLSMPRRMNVYHFKKGTEICNYSYSNNILSVRLNRQVKTRATALHTPLSSWFVLIITCSCARVAFDVSGLWCASKSRSTSTISKTWSSLRRCSTHPPTPQVDYSFWKKLKLCLLKHDQQKNNCYRDSLMPRCCQVVPWADRHWSINNSTAPLKSL